MVKICFSKLEFDVKERYNKIMIEILSYFVDICESHKLRYSLAYGSVLGAVRHKGIIPWDYDIDVYMPRPDYIKFIDIFLKQENKRYQLLLPDRTKNYPEPMAKLGDLNTSLLFSKYYPVDYGVFIDVFPLDGAAETEEKRELYVEKYYKYLRLFRICQSRLSLKDSFSLLVKGGYKHVILSLLMYPFSVFWKSFFLRQMDRISSRYHYDNSEYVTLYREPINHGWFPRKWIETTTKVPFEGIEVRIPSEFDSYLKYYYGDYMTFPPEDKRDDRHEIDYLNIDERESINQILDKLKS